MFTFKHFMLEEDSDKKTEWMTGSELAKHIPKTAISNIQKSKEHSILTNHDLAHGGNGQLHYRIHTKTYGNYKAHSVQVASSIPDKDGFTHHVTYNLIKNSATIQPQSHLKTNTERKLTLPFHQKVDK